MYHDTGSMYHLFFTLTKVLLAVLLWHLVHCQRSEFRIVKSVHCDTPGLKLLLDNVTILYHNSKSYLNARLLVIDDIKVIKKVHLHVERCNNQGQHCEHFTNIKTERLCQMISWRNQYRSNMINQFHPPFRCPFKKMTYEIRNATFDFDGITNWYPDMFKYRWKTTNKIYDERNDVVTCEILEVDIHEFGRQKDKMDRPEVG